MADRVKNEGRPFADWITEIPETQYPQWEHHSGAPINAGSEENDPAQNSYKAAEARDARGASWTAPDLSLLGTGRRPAPDFPIALLGDAGADWCRRSAEAASAPVDYVAASLLACTGAALANVRWATTEAGWSEPSVLWMAVVGSPSSGKSPAMRSVFDPLRYAEEQLAAGYDDELRTHQLAKELAEAKHAAWKAAVHEAVRSDGIAPPPPLDTMAPEPPVRPRIWAADVTMEKAANLAAGLPRGFQMVRDELVGWLGSFDRYGGGGSDRPFALEMYGGGAHIVDRVKNPEPLRIPHLSVGVLGGIQPDKLSAIINGPDDGLASRFLWCWPEALPNFRLARSRVDNRIAQSAFVRLTTLAMGTDELGRPEPKRLPLEPDAIDLLDQFGDEIHQQAGSASGLLAGALGKARGHALRLSCVLEHLWWCWGPLRPEPEQISATAMAAATLLMRNYFIPMAERTFGDAAIPSPERAAMVLARHLKRSRVRTFNARDVRRQIGGSLREPRAMDNACGVLEEAGLIRLKNQSATGPGRKAKDYEVNPRLYEDDPG